MIDIQLRFDIKDFDPLIEISFNGKVLYDGPARHEYNFNCETIHGLKSANNKLQIRRYGKDYKLHQDEKRDQAVIIKEISLNGTTFPDMASYGEFVTDTNETLHTNYLGHNGLYTFRFGSPVESWMVNKMYLHM